MTLHDNYVLNSCIALEARRLSAPRINARALPCVLYPYILDISHALTLSNEVKLTYSL